MDYEQFYRYLNSRPSAEIKDCLRRVVELAKNHSITVAEVHPAEDNETIIEQHRMQVSQRVWFQYAVWNKFGSKTNKDASLSEVAFAIADLCADSKVNDYIVKVNKSISEKINRENASNTKESKETAEGKCSIEASNSKR